MGGDTLPDIMRIVEEDIKEVIKEVRSLEWESLLVVGILIAAFVFSYFVVKRKIRSLPPGPPGLPDVGYLPYMKRNVHLDLVELGMKYGDIFSMRLGSVLVVFLNGAKAVEEAFSKTQLSGHPPDDIIKQLQDISKFFVRNIHQWNGHEEYVAETLKDLDLMQVKLGGVAKEEIKKLLEFLASHNGKPMELNAPLSANVLKAITALVNDNKQNITNDSDTLQSNSTNLLDDGKKERTDNMSNGVVSNPFESGSETVLACIMWCMYVIAAFPDVQEKVRKEVLDIVGPDRQTELEDMENMSYTRAVIMETLRWKTVIPLNAMRYTLSDATVSGYHIPRGTVVIANFWSVHNDPKYWIEADNFNPDRFLDKDGCFVKHNSFMPFSVGKRSCPGEHLSLAVIFLYFTSIIQKFRVKLSEEVEPKFEANLNVTYSLNPYRIRFTQLS